MLTTSSVPFSNATPTPVCEAAASALVVEVPIAAPAVTEPLISTPPIPKYIALPFKPTPIVSVVTPTTRGSEAVVVGLTE